LPGLTPDYVVHLPGLTPDYDTGLEARAATARAFFV
jgi:hypothetical protein